MLGAHALYKIDCSEVSLLYLFRKKWANGSLEQHDDLCWEPMRSIKLIVRSIVSSNAVLIVFKTCFGSIYFVRYGLMGPGSFAPLPSSHGPCLQILCCFHSFQAVQNSVPFGYFFKKFKIGFTLQGQ